MANQAARVGQLSNGLGFNHLFGKPIRIETLSSEELDRFHLRARADRLTFQRYVGLRQLRLWEAAALFTRLDPAVLALHQSGRLKGIKRVALMKLPRFNAFHAFIIIIPEALRAMHIGELRCTKSRLDPLQSFVAPEHFRDWAERRGFGFVEDSADADDVISPDFYDKFRRVLIEAHELWKPASLGGNVRPGDYSSEPNVFAFLCANGIPESKSRLIARALRPPTAAKGRRAGERGKSELGLPLFGQPDRPKRF